MKNLTWWIVGGVVVLLVVILAAKQFNAYQPPSITQPQTSTSTGVQPSIESAQPSAEASIEITSSGFVQQTLNIKAGTKVTWMNKSGVAIQIASAPHPTHTAYPPLNLGQVIDGGSVSLVFGELGTYKYHNHLNPTQFGSIVVE